MLSGGAAGMETGARKFSAEVPMRTRILLTLIILCSSAVWAADKIVPPNIKIGLWEITETHNMSGMPQMPTIPPEALAEMTPEQRAQVEAQMKGSMGGGQKTTTRKSCVTNEKLEKDSVFGDDRKECTRTVVSSSSTSTEVKIQCKEKEMTSEGTFKFVAVTPESVKGTVRMVMTGEGRTINMNVDFLSKYLGSACGDVK
jgi:hypothetical protein